MEGELKDLNKLIQLMNKQSNFLFGEVHDSFTAELTQNAAALRRKRSATATVKLIGTAPIHLNLLFAYATKLVELLDKIRNQDEFLINIEKLK